MHAYVCVRTHTQCQQANTALREYRILLLLHHSFQHILFFSSTETFLLSLKQKPPGKASDKSEELPR